MDQDEPTPGEPPTVPPSLAQRRELTQSVRFDRQPDGHFRAVLVDKPPKSLAEIMSGLLRGLPPAVRDASLSPPPESPPVDSPMGEEAAGQMGIPSPTYAERVSSPDASRRGFHIDGRDLRRAKKIAARAQLAGAAQRVMGAGASDETGRFDDADGLEEGEVFSGTSESPRSGSGGGTSKSPRSGSGFSASKSPRSGPGSGPPSEAMEGVEYPVTGGKKYMPHEGMPEWYQQVTALEERELKKRRPQEIIALEALKTCITRCEDAEKKHDHGALQQLHEELRNHVHKAEVTLRMDRAKTKVSRILTTQNGLPRIFSGHGGLPHDLKADAFQLYSRWWCGNFDQDLLRGIIIKKGKDRNGDRIDPEYRKVYPTTAKFYGDDGFVLGQWWPTQLCTVRDGAHGAAQGGIFGDKEKGTYSIVLSGGGYHDVDDGNSIEYSGTDGKNFTATEATSQMITSARLGNPIRVIRSAQLHKGNEYRPERGLRYDGLYVIKSYKEVDKEAQKYRFSLERCPGQAPIRCGDGNSRRPTLFEMHEYDKLKGRV